MRRGLPSGVLLLLLLLAAGIAAAAMAGQDNSLREDIPPTATPPPATALPVPTPQASPAPSAVDAGFWHTSGTRIVDASGTPVRIASVTWYGMESSYWVPAGLDYQPYTKILDLVKHLGYNAVRLPFSNELVERNPTVRDKVGANPEFQGKHALFVMDSIANYAQAIGLKLILDNHRGAASRPRNVNVLVDGLWYSRAYPEAAWIRDWRILASRYRANNAVIGFDLRNEPHTNGPGPWTLRTYLNQGSTWGPFQGRTNPATDWRLAAERAGNAVLAINPHLLLFVEGVQLYPDARQAGGVDTYFWSGILTPVKLYPVIFNVPHQLVYSPHDWGPFKTTMPWFRNMTYASLKQVWHEHWSFLLDNPQSPYAAPIWIGEFGTCTNRSGCVDERKPGNQATWLHSLVRYFHDHPVVSWSFYALNGTNSNNHIAHNGLLNPTWTGVSNQHLQDLLSTVQK